MAVLKNTDTKKSEYAETLIAKALESQESFDKTLGEINVSKGPDCLHSLLSYTKQKIMTDLKLVGNVVTPIYDGVTIYINGNLDQDMTDAYRRINKAFEMSVRALG